jgi:hypothetical protein
MGVSENYGKPELTEEFAQSIIGKYILVGITRLDHQGTELSRQQLHGIVRSTSSEGIQIELKGVHEGHSWNMPPDFRAISQAGPGVYKLKTTGEEIEDPDLLANWTINEPAPNN